MPDRGPVDLELITRRQAVTEWRDRQITSVMHLLNDAATLSRSAFELQIVDAGLIESFWDPLQFVGPRVDQLMASSLVNKLEHFLAEAGRELRALDDRFESLAAALEDSAPALIMPKFLEHPASIEEAEIASQSQHEAPATAPSNDAEAAGVLARLGDRLSTSSISRSAREWRTWAAGNVLTAAEVLSRKLQDSSGLDERLKRSATERIAQAWLGDHGDPLPLKAQMFNLIEEVASEARSMNL